jgi:site-specific DNA recombinase
MPESHSTKPVRVAAYIRMSTSKQEDSPGRQREVVYPHCRDRGYHVTGEYLDEGIAGDEFDKRKDFQRLLRDAREGAFDGIVVDQKDRLSRQTVVEYIATVVHPLQQAGVWVESATQGRLDWDSMGGLLTDHILQHQASAESPGIAYRTMTALVVKARRGDGVGGPVPYGYVMTYRTERGPDGRTRRVPERYALGDPRHVEVVRWLFATYAAEDVSIDWLRDELHRRGVPGPRGSERWGKTTILRLLGNRRYLGDWVYNRKHCGKWASLTDGKVRAAGRRQKARKNPEADWVVIPDHHPALVGRDTFQAVQAKLRANRERRTPKKGGGDFVLNKLLVCGHCGSWMWGMTEKRGRRVYRCGGNCRFGSGYCSANSVPEGLILAALVGKVRAVFLNPEHLSALRAEVRRQEEAERDPGAVDGLRRRLAALDRDIDRGNGNLAVLPPDRLPAVIAKVRGWEAERDRLRAELDRLTNGSRVKALEAQIAKVEKQLWELGEAVQHGTPAEIRAALRELVAKVQLSFDRRKVRVRTLTRWTGGVIYLRGEDGAAQETADLDTMGSHMHHGLHALRKHLEPLVGVSH